MPSNTRAAHHDCFQVQSSDFLCHILHVHSSGAEELYKYSVECNPHDPEALCDYAAFLCQERRSLDEAEELLKWVWLHDVVP